MMMDILRIGQFKKVHLFGVMVKTLIERIINGFLWNQNLRQFVKL